jgi:predicted permease
MQADAELATLMPAQALLTQMSFNMPDPDFTPIPAKFHPIYQNGLLTERTDTESKDRKLSVSLAGGSLLLLLISCANVSGLLLSRALERQREITIRMQLGASRSRIVSQLFTETVVLMAVSGLVAAAMLVPVIAGVRTLLPFAQDSLFPDMRILGIMLLTLGVATLVTGIFPALQTVRSQSVGAPGQGTHLVSTRSKLRSTLVVVQIALALALAIGTGLFVRSASRIGDVELGYEPNGLSDVTVNLRSIGYAVPEISRVHEAMLESVRRLDFVASAALTYADMVTDRKGGYAEDGHAYFNANDATPIGGMAFPPMVRIVSLGYFSAFKTRILQGRDFTASDMGRSDVVIVDQRLADKLWPKQNPLGQCVRVKPDAPCSIVVGVCEYQNMARIMSIGGFTMYQYFLPWSPVSTLIDGRAAVTSPQPTIMYIRVRDKAGVNDANGALRAAIDKAVPNLPFIKIVPATAKLDEDARLWTLGAEILSWFGGIAIAVAALGVYGVLAFFLRQRTAEIGLRMALGATPGDILFFIFRKGFVLVAVGILLGFMASWWFSRLLQSLLVEFGVESTDPAAFAVAACVVLLVAGLACLIPAWRASRLDPMHALRHAQGGIAARRNA